MPWHRRLRNISIVVGSAVILFFPIAAGLWDLRQATVLPSAAEVDDPRVSRYLSVRSPMVDRLLPVGAGGVRFSDRIENAGEAHLEAAAIVLNPDHIVDGWPESTELHERAHLAFAFLAPETGALLARLPAPAPDEYAAKNGTEHFAEMAKRAWQLVAPPGDFCPDLEGVDGLTIAEALVPGTAGLVAWYLRQPDLVVAGDRAALAEAADRLMAPYRAEWDAIGRGLDARRRADGTFDPWTAVSVREHIEIRRASSWAEGTLLGRVHAVLLTPSLAIARAAGL